MSTTAITPSPTPGEPEQGLSEISRITNVFFAPSATFTDLKRKPSWWVAWLLISALSFPLVFAIQQKVGFAQIVRNEISASTYAREAIDKLPADQREQQIEARARIGQYISYAVPITILIIYCLIAGVMMGTFNFGLGTEIPFSLSLAIVMYAYLPNVLKSLLATISLYAGADPESFDSYNPAATNLGFFISRTDHPVLHALGSWVDIFGVWIVVLLGIGFASVSKVKRSTAIYVVAGWYVFIALAFTGLAAIFS